MVFGRLFTGITLFMGICLKYLLYKLERCVGMDCIGDNGGVGASLVGGTKVGGNGASRVGGKGITRGDMIEKYGDKGGGEIGGKEGVYEQKILLL
jgi:hypothetical protein